MALTKEEKKTRKEKRDEYTKTKKYLEHKDALEIICSNMILLKWEALSKAYTEGKNIWGKKFTVARLAKDMEIPIAEVKSCLLLDKASMHSWKLLKYKQLTALKLIAKLGREKK